MKGVRMRFLEMRNMVKYNGQCWPNKASYAAQLQIPKLVFFWRFILLSHFLNNARFVY